MGRIFTIAMQYLVTLFVLTLGLNFSGCSDSASVNPVVELASLTVTSGTTPATLQPSFNQATTNYTVNLSTNLTSITVTAQPAVAGDSVTINGEATTSRPIALGGAGTTTPVNVVVSESGTNSRTYTVLLTKASLTGNNSLRSLSISPGSLNPGFNTNTLSYEVSVASNVSSMRVTPTLDDPPATMTVNGQPATSGQAQTIPLRDPGQNTIFTITVTAQNGTQKTYTVVVAREALSANNNLSALHVTPGTLTPTFAPDQLPYTVDVATGVSSLTVTATLQDLNAGLMINGQGTSSGQAREIPLAPPGSNTVITMLVRAPSGAERTYTVTVRRPLPSSDATLSVLTVSAGTLNPGFSASTPTYTVTVPASVDSLTVTATKSDPNAVMSASGSVIAAAGVATGSVSSSLGLGTTTVFTITVIAQDGVSTRPYTITVFRDSR